MVAHNSKPLIPNEVKYPHIFLWQTQSTDNLTGPQGGSEAVGPEPISQGGA